LRVYIETTIPSYVVARDARDMHQATRQLLARDWWFYERLHHDVFVSELVLNELSHGDEELAQLRLELVQDIAVLDMLDDARVLAKEILASGLLPQKAASDAGHIAIASAHSMDVLLTWNCRHIANASIADGLRRLIESRGFSFPILGTPQQFLEYDEDDSQEL
jgi:predicted nucleic acid-binding protein